MFIEESRVLLVVRLDCCVQDGGGSELHPARPGAAGSLLQLQHSHIVGRGRAQDASRDEKCQLRAAGRPVTSHVKAVDPNLTLKEEKELKGLTDEAGTRLSLKPSNSLFLTFKAGLQIKIIFI